MFFLRLSGAIGECLGCTSKHWWWGDLLESGKKSDPGVIICTYLKWEVCVVEETVQTWALHAHQWEPIILPSRKASNTNHDRLKGL